MTAVLLGIFASAISTVVGGIVLFAMRTMFQSRQSQGERLGRLEDWRKFEEGRRAGLAEQITIGAAASKAIEVFDEAGNSLGVLRPSAFTVN